MIGAIPSPNTNETGQMFFLIPGPEGILALSADDYHRAVTKGREIATPRPPETVTGSPADEIMDAEQVAQRTGIPASWWLEAARSGKVAHIKAGKYVRFRLAHVLDGLEIRPPGAIHKVGGALVDRIQARKR